MSVGILGGGISGLALARFLQDEAWILEKNTACGGLCRSFEKNGFIYDQGGHVIFSSNRGILDFEISIMGDNVHQKRRNSKVWYKRRFVKYPFENGLSALDKEEIFECLRDYLQNPHPKPSNLKEWFYYTFGAAMAEKYMIPYTQKIWKTDPAEMGLEWVERIPKPPVEDVIKSAVGVETEGYRHQLHYYYPKTGGFESLPRAFERGLSNVYTGVEVRSVRRKGSGWAVDSSGRSFEFDRIVSTIPVHELARIVDAPMPPAVEKALEGLRFNSLIVVLVGLSAVKHQDLATVYVAERGSLAHRYCFNGGFSEHLAPAGCSSIFAEITARPADMQALSDRDAINNTIDWLEKEGFVAKKEVCETDVRRVQYAYPVYDKNYTQNVKTVRAHFETLGIHLLGRFAQFIYVNSDVCIQNAKALAQVLNEEISHGSRER